jgi:hypothetical protein
MGSIAVKARLKMGLAKMALKQLYIPQRFPGKSCQTIMKWVDISK